MKQCPNCATVNEDNSAFCVGCGAALPQEEKPAAPSYSQPAAQPVYPQQPVASAYPQQTYSQPYGYAVFNENMLPQEYKPVTIGQYIGYSILFSLPLVGLIMMIITAFSSEKNVSLRNFAKAYLILTLIGAVVGIIATIFMVTVAGAAYLY